MFGLQSKLSDNLVLLVLASFAFMNVLGMGIGMEMTDGLMSPCPFMAGQTTMCQMNIMEHIAQWQQALLGIPTKANLLALAIVLLVVVITPLVKQFSRLEELIKFASRRFADRTKQAVKVFDPFLLAFSDGIINPRIY